MATSDMMVTDNVRGFLFATNRKSLRSNQCVGGDEVYRGISGVIVPYQGNQLSKAHDKFNRTLRREHSIAKRSVKRIQKFGMFASSQKYMETIPQWFKLVAQIANFKAKYKYKYHLPNRLSYSQVLRKVKRWQTHIQETPSVPEIQHLED